MTFTCAITHQKHLAQSGRSTRSAVDNFYTLRVLTKEPIREQDIKLECMNCCQHASMSFLDVCVYTTNDWIYIEVDTQFPLKWAFVFNVFKNRMINISFKRAWYDFSDFFKLLENLVSKESLYISHNSWEI